MNKLVEFVENYKKSNPTGWRKWIYGLVAAVVVVVLIAIFAVQAAQRGRALADLKHAKDLAEEAVHSAKLAQTLATNKVEQERHEAAAEASMDRAAELAESIKVLEEEHRASESVLDGLRSWSDVDKVVK